MKNLAKEIDLAGIILRNVNQPRIKEALATYGYDEARLKEAQALLNRFEMLQQTKKEEYRSKGKVGRSLRNDNREMHQRFVDHRSLAKYIFRNDTDGYQRLELHQPIASQQADKMVQMRQFYAEALSSHALFTRHGLSKAELAQAQTMVEALVDVRRARLQKSGEAQHATQQRNQVRRELRAWVVDFRIIARVALRNEPQLLEALGMTVTA